MSTNIGFDMLQKSMKIIVYSLHVCCELAGINKELIYWLNELKVHLINNKGKLDSNTMISKFQLIIELIRDNVGMRIMERFESIDGKLPDKDNYNRENMHLYYIKVAKVVERQSFDMSILKDNYDHYSLSENDEQELMSVLDIVKKFDWSSLIKDSLQYRQFFNTIESITQFCNEPDK